jgi:hypothetical protein
VNLNPEPTQTMMDGVVSGQYYQKRLSYECIADDKHTVTNKSSTTTDGTKAKWLVIGLLLTLLMGYSLSPNTAELSSPPAAAVEVGNSLAKDVSSSALPDDRIKFTHAVIRGTDGNWAIALHPSTGDAEVEYAAVGAFTDADKHPSYFGELHVKTSPSSSFSEQERAEAAGVLEGYLTHERMGQTSHNLLCEVGFQYC